MKKYQEIVIKCAVFEYATPSGRGCISDSVKADRKAQAAVKLRIDDIRRHGVGTEETRQYCPHMKRGIYKLKVRYKPQLRPHLCKGPERMDDEATLLVMATEENDKLTPVDVIEIAITRRDEIFADPQKRKRYGSHSK